MRKYIFFATATIALAACNNDDNLVEEPIAAQISASIGKSAVSRASDESWDKGDIIGITLSDNSYVNMKYTTLNGDGTFTGNTIYFKNKREPVNLSAYYPFSGSEGTATQNITGSTSIEWQDGEKQRSIDFLYAVAENVRGDVDPKVNFTFSHKMSKLTFKFKDGTGIMASDLISYDIEGLKLDGTFNLATGDCTVNADSQAKSLTIDINGKASNDRELSPLIIFPQTIPSEVKLKITDKDNQYYVCNLFDKDSEILSGHNYSFTITVNKTGLEVGNISINPWTEESNDVGATFE